MNVITVEQFKSAEMEVQKALLVWYNPSIYDMVCVSGTYNCLYEDAHVDTVLSYIYSTDFEVIPLLTVGQLIEFIEWKTSGPVDISRTDESTEIMWWLDGEVAYHTDVETDNLLEALWKCAQTVCIECKTEEQRELEFLRRKLDDVQKELFFNTVEPRETVSNLLKLFTANKKQEEKVTIKVLCIDNEGMSRRLKVDNVYNAIDDGNYIINGRRYNKSRFEVLE